VAEENVAAAVAAATPAVMVAGDITTRPFIPAELES
jgi:hypothetical protein